VTWTDAEERRVLASKTVAITEVQLLAACDGRYLTLAKLGAIFGVSRQRIFQVLKARPIERITHRDFYKKFRRDCEVCTQPLALHALGQYHRACTPKVALVCGACGKPFELSTSMAEIRIRRLRQAIGLFCSTLCALKWRWELLRQKPEYDKEKADRSHAQKKRLWAERRVNKQCLVCGASAEPPYVHCQRCRARRAINAKRWHANGSKQLK
jgi:DNA-directed RNA polymerase subunit RPC12/RpoP/uncharacterized CHY-type Zn-finger protein